MLGRYLEDETHNKKWIWVLLIVATVAFVMFFLCKKSKKRKKRVDTDSYDYLTTGEECIACGKNENQDFGMCKNNE